MQTYVIHDAKDFQPLGEHEGETPREAIEEWREAIARKNDTAVLLTERAPGVYHAHMRGDRGLDVTALPHEEFWDRHILDVVNFALNVIGVHNVEIAGARRVTREEADAMNQGPGPGDTIQ